MEITKRHINSYILSEYNILKVFEELRRELSFDNKNYFSYIGLKNNRLVLTCPYHKDGQEKRPSANILLEDKGKLFAGFFHCYTCGKSTDLYTLISEILYNKNDFGFSGEKWIYRKLGINQIVNIEQDMQAIIDTLSIDKYKKIKKDYITEQELDSYRYTHPYLYERGISDEVIEKFDIGYQKDYLHNNRKYEVITIPIKDKLGRVETILRRTILGKRYFIEKNTIKGLFGRYELKNKIGGVVIITEGIFDALSLWSWGYEAIALQGLGTSEQIKELEKIPRIFAVCFDGDSAGREASKKIMKQCKSIFYNIEMWKGYDINDITKDDFYRLYKFYVEEKHGNKIERSFNRYAKKQFGM